MANPGSKKIATHPQSTPQAIPLSNYERHPFWPLGKGCDMGVFLSGVLKQLYRKNTPTIYTLSVGRSGSVNGVYTYIPLIYHLCTIYIPLIYSLLGGYMLPTYHLQTGNQKQPLSPGCFLGAPEISGPLRCWCAVSQDASGFDDA